MEQNTPWCIRVSDSRLSCPYCKEGKIIKNGTTKTGKQQYYCKTCNKRFIESYTYRAYSPEINQNIILLTKEGLGIRSTARVLQISTTTLLKKIVSIARSIRQPVIPFGKAYEVDEIKCYVKRKDRPVWVVYALERQTKQVVALNIGCRTNQMLKVVVDTVMLSQPLVVYTDKLKHYKYLIDESIHSTRRFGTNRIERKNLSVRTHLRRLNRRTICFSRSKLVLLSVLKIYFWL